MQKQAKPAEQAPQGQEAEQIQPLPMHVDVHINTITPNSSNNVRAYASADINGCFKIDNIKVVEGSNGLFVSMPSFKSNGEYVDYCLPVTKEFREQLHNQILEAYRNAPTQTPQERQPAQVLPTDVTVRITKIKPEGDPVCAYATANLNGSLGIRGLRVMQGEDGYSVAMPGYKSNGRFHAVCFPTDNAFRQQFSDAILMEYGHTLGQLHAQGQAVPQQENAQAPANVPQNGGQPEGGGQSQAQ